MFSGGFKEVIESTVRMPEDDPDAFDLFMEWIYAGRLNPPDVDKHTPKSGPEPCQVILLRGEDLRRRLDGLYHFFGHVQLRQIP
jgi:hypothetical protein